MSNLSPDQLEAVRMLASGSTHAEIAAKLGISTKTVQRWTKRSEFHQAVVDVQSRAIEKAIERSAVDIAGQLERLIPKALKTLELYIDNPDARGSDRLRACHIVGSWAGLNQSQRQVEPVSSPEDTLKGYLQYLANNGNNPSN